MATVKEKLIEGDVKVMQPIILPDDVSFVGTPGTTADVVTTPGHHGLWVPIALIDEYTKRGVHIAKAGEGFVPDEGLYRASKEGYLQRGTDCYVGVISMKAYEKILAQLAERVKREKEDVIVSNRPITQ